MAALPRQVVHDPFEAGPYRMAMALTVVPDAAWFEIDCLYPQELGLKRHLLTWQHNDVFAALPCSDAARREALTMVIQHLTSVHPTWFQPTGQGVYNCLTQETLDVTMSDPLEIAGRLVQEDLCIIQNTEAGPIFIAGVLCFPSRWRLADKIGRPLAEVHAAVPFYADRLAQPVDRFMRHLRPGRIVSRLNWSILDDPALFQPDGKWRSERDDGITADNAGNRLFLRVERQTLRLLPSTEAVLFGIRVHVYPLSHFIGVAARLAAAVRALPEEIAHYKSLPPFQDALLAWLDRAAR